MKPENVHDRFFKQTFSDKSITIALIEQFLPEEVTKSLDFTTFELTKDSFITKKLKEYFADLVFECQTNTAEKIKITLLLEHKSYPVKFPHFQLLQYMLGVWEQSRKSGETLKLVLPIVIYHGTSKWKYQGMDNYFGKIEEQFIKYLPQFTYELIDISQMSDERIQGFRNFFLSTALVLMKYREQEKFFFDNLKYIFAKFETHIDTETGENFLETLIIYTSKIYTFTNQKLDNMMETLEKTSKTRKKTITFYDYFVEKGLREGREKGLEQGIEQGIEQAHTNTIIKSYKKGISIEIIAEITDLTIEQVKKILVENGL